MAAADAPLQRTSVDFACGRRLASPGRREPLVPLPAVALDASAPSGAPDLTTDRRRERGPAAAGDILAYENELGALLLSERYLQLIGVSFRRAPSRTSGTSSSSMVDRPWSLRSGSSATSFSGSARKSDSRQALSPLRWQFMLCNATAKQFATPARLLALQ